MRRESIIRKSQGAMLAGWISSTDAMLLGLILTLAATLLVAGQVRKSERMNETMQNALAHLQAQHDDDITDLAERGRQIADKQRVIDEITARLTSVQKRLDILVTAESKSNKENKRLTTDNDNLRAQLSALLKDFRKTQETLELADADKRVVARQLVTLTAERDAVTRELKLVNADKRAVAMQLVTTTAELNTVKREAVALRNRVDAELGLHKELIGLQGKMQRVVIVFDTSGSMNRDGRWEHARGVVSTWLEHLAIRECALVLFSTNAGVVPPDGSFLEMQGLNGPDNRNRLLEQIKATKPDGGTNTLSALQMAYQCPGVDTIILFTDGEPTSGKSNQFDAEMAERIYALCQEHNQIPVNTVGIGAFYQPKLSGFLMRVAQETGGSFLGR